MILNYQQYKPKKIFLNALNVESIKYLTQKIMPRFSFDVDQ